MLKSNKYVIALLSLFTASCAGGQFSLHKGFQTYFNSIDTSLPSSSEVELLEKHRPLFYLGEQQELFIDFYSDYIANGVLRNCKGGEIISTNPSSAQLNEHRDNALACFTHQPPRDGYSKNLKPVYARVDYDFVAGKKLTFLSYNLVFPRSGLPYKLSWYKQTAMWLIASTKDWHQLDNYVNATIVLNASEQPIAALIQQHNYTTTLIPGLTIDTPSGDSGFSFDVALRSNELYPHSAQKQERRAVSFFNEKSLAYMIKGTKPPLLSGDDVTLGEVPIDYRLETLPKDDAFYRFLGKLGEKRRLPGRSGPPGAEFNTIPGLKPYGKLLVASYRRAGEDLEYLSLYNKLFDDFFAEPNAPILQRLEDRFIEDVQSAGFSL